MRARLWLAAGAAGLLMVAASATAVAAPQYSTPAEAVSGLTGQTVEAVQAARINTGTTYGQMAAEAGVLNEFKAEILEQKKEALDTHVAEGRLTQEQADQRAARMEAHQAICDGSGQQAGAGLVGRGAGAGAGRGVGVGPGDGTGTGAGTGVCPNGGVCDGTGAGTGPGNGTGTGPGNGTGVGPGDGTGTGAGTGVCPNGGVCDGTGAGGGQGIHQGAGQGMGNGQGMGAGQGRGGGRR